MSAKPLLLYAPIYRYTAEIFVDRMNEVPAEDDLEIWVNSPGGLVFGGWGIIGPVAERKGKVTMKVFGDASSMALYMLLFADHVESIDTSNFIIHRADGYTETDEQKKWLADINKEIRAKLEMKIDAETFEKVTGKTFDELFSMEGRLDIRMSAKEAKKIGLVDKVIRLEPKSIEAQTITDKFVAFADFEDSTSHGSEADNPEVHGSTDTPATDSNVEQKKPVKMTKEELKAQHPDVYNAIFADGESAGKAKEKDRVEAFLQYMHIDAEAVSEKIASGEDISQKFMSEMNVKAMSPEALKTAAEAAAAADAGDTDDEEPEGEQSAEEKEVEQFAAEAAAAAGVTIEEDK